MPRQVPALAHYEAANPYGRATQPNAHDAWRDGASAPLDAPVPKFATQGELEAFTEGVTWRMTWEQEHNPFASSAMPDVPVPAPGEVIEVLELRESTAKLYHLNDSGAKVAATVAVTPAPTAEGMGHWHDGRLLTLFTHGSGRQQVVIGDLGRVVEVIKQGVILKDKNTVLHIADSFVIATESLESFTRATGGSDLAAAQLEGKATTQNAHGDWFKGATETLARADYVPGVKSRDNPLPQPDGLRPNFKELISTKTLGHELGFSCCFRQHRAHSHCRFLHGYALGFKFVFAASTLSPEGWVVDFGGLKNLKGLLEDTFDHRTLVAEDDPMKDEILALAGLGVLSAVVVPATGCEAFARMVYEVTEQWLLDAGFSPRVRLVSVEVSEHGANSAIAQG